MLPTSQRISSAFHGLTSRALAVASTVNHKTSIRTQDFLQSASGEWLLRALSQRSCAVVAAAAKPSRPKPAKAPPWVLIQKMKRGGKAQAQRRDPAWRRRSKNNSTARQSAVKIWGRAANP